MKDRKWLTVRDTEKSELAQIRQSNLLWFRRALRAKGVSKQAESEHEANYMELMAELVGNEANRLDEMMLHKMESELRKLKS